MNPIGKPVVLTANFKRLGLLGAIGLICFFVFQLLIPSVTNQTQEPQAAEVITKQQAAAKATQFAQTTLGYKGAVPSEPVVTYQSRSNLYGYLTQHNLLQTYDRTWKTKYPYDLFRVYLPDTALSYTLQIDVDMNTGKVVAFKRKTPNTDYIRADAATNNQSRDILVHAGEGDMTVEQKQQIAAPLLKQFGYTLSELQLVTTENEPGLTYVKNDAKIGDSVLNLSLTFEAGVPRSFDQTFSVPATYTGYIEKQTYWANWMTYAGYGGLTFVLGILAIVYASLTRRHTSFSRGILLTLLYLAASLIGAFNMLPILQAESFDRMTLIFVMGVQVVVTFVMAAMLYFSLVGGDGLTRQAGRNAWPRAKEPGYGLYVLRSMFTGYLWAFILLGVQSIIFFVLEHTIHTWSTTDSTQSPYNMAYPWIMPILAWMAGIGEEGVYRFFGIPMLKKFVKNTFAACLITTLIWAFGHTLYPIYPVISRPIELVCIGLIFSFVFLRYGFIAVMFAHVIFDSILMGFSLMSMGDSVNLAAGIFWIVVPAIVGYVIYLLNPTKKEKPYITTPHPEGQL